MKDWGLRGKPNFFERLESTNVSATTILYFLYTLLSDKEHILFIDKEWCICLSVSWKL